MAEKIIAASQLRKLAQRSKAHSAAGIAELSELMIAALEAVRHTGITVTLPASGWNGGVQTIRHESLLADGSCWYFVCGDAGCLAEFNDAGVKADNITVNGQATFRCETVPENDLTAHILRLEVES